MLVTALFLSLVANRLVEAVVEPLRKKYPGLDMWWLIYVAWALGGVLSWLAKINLFAEMLPDAPLAGLLLSAIVVGGGANLIHDIFDGR